MYNEQQKEFSQKLRSLSYSRSVGGVFTDWLEIAAITLHQLPYHAGELPKDEAFETLETKYMEWIKPYSKEELITFSELLGLTLYAHQGNYQDFLGEIAEDELLLNKRGGQFFTPYIICQAMTKMSFGDMKEQLKGKGILTVCEPAVGGGAMVIASAEEVASQGIDPRSCLQFDCTDVSRDAFNMAYIQLSALGLQAVVRHGNSLSMEYWEHRATPQLRLFHQWLAPHRKTQKVVQAVRSILAEDVQPTPTPEAEAAPSPTGTLFDLAPFTDSLPAKKKTRKQQDLTLNRQTTLFDL
ncbi:hypothetical protein S7335_1273 [Synechococcus sp. PCC 7335]|uniref:N-6 DNA methylase n=1 Tax=Synechococcus sp. (strain ATCC 29403 / PCC 7335) TaxID=91464 RepID=UPI00017EB560|nr:N-6 DNA methylase [Synechococcus sp. PCC 7335]EDX82569.1 hypothetical protein S7335_1273 [Synechococcus sp. PCC 7335]